MITGGCRTPAVIQKPVPPPAKPAMVAPPPAPVTRPTVPFAPDEDGSLEADTGTLAH